MRKATRTLRGIRSLRGHGHGGGTPGTPLLNPLALSASTIAEGSVEDTVVGAIQNNTSGSTLSMTDTASGKFKLTGTNVVAGASATDYETATSHNITIRETKSGPANSPRDTVLTITVTDVDEGTADFSTTFHEIGQQ